MTMTDEAITAATSKFSLEVKNDDNLGDIQYIYVSYPEDAAYGFIRDSSGFYCSTNMNPNAKDGSKGNKTKDTQGWSASVCRFDFETLKDNITISFD